MCWESASSVASEALKSGVCESFAQFLSYNNLSEHPVICAVEHLLLSAIVGL